MSRMQTIQATRTSDGKVFADHSEAVAHQAVLDFQDAYQENRLYGRQEGCVIDAVSMMSWLLENREMVQNLLHQTAKS